MSINAQATGRSRKGAAGSLGLLFNWYECNRAALRPGVTRIIRATLFPVARIAMPEKAEMIPK